MENSGAGQVKWTYLSSKDGYKIDAGPKYSRFSESIRHAAPGALQCSMFCGGKQCKYENPAKMKSKEMAIQGLYSSWVTKGILATARPSSEIIRNYKIIEQFKQNGIQSIINLQHPDEHSSCGFGLQTSGFSYEPEEFMQAEIFYYNFGWNDYGVRSLESILDMVKVMSFALQEGKAAVHCHAGLGRTGVLISCYLIYSQRLEAEEAIHLMRENRPKAVQTRGQIECVKNFSNFLKHFWIIFPSCHPDWKKFTLQHYLTRQKHLLHGMEGRELKNLPKIVCLTCSRLLELANVKSEDTKIKWTLSVDAKKVFSEPKEPEEPDEPDSSPVIDTQETPDDLKHNPYVEAEIVHRQDSLALQRSQSTDDIIGGPLVEPGVNVPLHLMSDCSKVSRSHSQPDISQNSTSCSEGGSFQPPTTSGSAHGVRLQPLNLDKLNGKTTPPGAENQVECGRIHDQEEPESNAPATSTLPKLSCSQEDRDIVAKAMGTSACVDPGIQNRTDKLKRKLNASDAGWDELKIESDPWVLSRLLWTWLEDLEEPVLIESDIDVLSCEADPIAAVKKLRKGHRDTLECIMTTVSQLEPLPDQIEERVLRRVAMVLTHDRTLPLTSPRASLDRVACTEGEDDQNPPLGEVDESDVPSCSVQLSSCYRLLVFLRHLIRTLQGQNS